LLPPAFPQVRRTKEVLSANTGAPFSVEELHEGLDFSSSIKREELEEMAGGWRAGAGAAAPAAAPAAASQSAGRRLAAAAAGERRGRAGSAVQHSAQPGGSSEQQQQQQQRQRQRQRQRQER
jgi:hypothetical protein